MKQSTNFLKTLFLALFIIFAIANLISEFFFFKVGIFATKPMLLILLAAYFYVETKNFKGSFRNLLIFGFLFSFGGDTLLMFVENTPPSQGFFLFGLGSFLITHILYSLAFFKFPSNKKGLIGRKPIYTLFFLVFLILNVSFLWTGIPSAMKIPVVLYSITIMAMGIGALNLNGKISKRAFQFIFYGALLFMISDTLIGVNKFRGADVRIPLVRIWIMSIYLAGQFLIARGGILALSERTK